MDTLSSEARAKGAAEHMRLDQVASQADADRYAQMLMSGQADEDRAFHTNPDFVLREIAGEGVLVPVGAGAERGNLLFSLNDTGLFLWKAFEKPITIARAIQKVREAYDDPEGSMESHVRAFVLAMLVKRMILED